MKWTTDQNDTESLVVDMDNVLFSEESVINSDDDAVSSADESQRSNNGDDVPSVSSGSVYTSPSRYGTDVEQNHLEGDHVSEPIDQEASSQAPEDCCTNSTRSADVDTTAQADNMSTTGASDISSQMPTVASVLSSVFSRGSRSARKVPINSSTSVYSTVSKNTYLTDADTAAAVLENDKIYQDEYGDDLSTLANDMTVYPSMPNAPDGEYPSNGNSPRRDLPYPIEKKESGASEGSRWTSRHYMCAGSMAIALIAVAVGLLVIILHFYQSEPKELTQTGDAAFDDLTLRPTLPLLPIETSEPTQQPSPRPLYPTMRPTRRPTSRPTRSPTVPPSPSPSALASASPTISAEEDLRRILRSSASSSTLITIEINGSAQQRAFDWVTNDPSYFSLLRRRKVQRFALAVLYYTVTASGRRYEALSNWMDYDSEECDWFQSWYDNRLPCGEDQVMKFVALKNLGLVGTLPRELSLLSKLDSILLPLNELTGTIPDDISRMTSLQSLDLTNNNLVGQVSSNFCDMSMIMLAVDCNEVACSCCTNCR